MQGQGLATLARDKSLPCQPGSRIGHVSQGQELVKVSHGLPDDNSLLDSDQESMLYDTTTCYDMDWGWENEGLISK